jgi:hypothetical protein
MTLNMAMVAPIPRATLSAQAKRDDNCKHQPVAQNPQAVTKAFPI